MKYKKLTYTEHVKVAKLLNSSIRNLSEVIGIAQNAYGVNCYPIRVLTKLLPLGGKLSSVKSWFDDRYFIEYMDRISENPYYTNEDKPE